MKISRRFFWVTVALSLSAMGLIWFERILLAVDEAHQGNWWPIVAVVAIFAALFVVLGVMFKETVPTKKRKTTRSPPRFARKTREKP